jgi:hypothetical protein
VLPFTIGGGLGIRELVFFEGAKYFGVDQHIAVAVSLLFYLITLAASLPGIIFVFKNLCNETNESCADQKKNSEHRCFVYQLFQAAAWLFRLNKNSVVIDCGANTGRSAPFSQ